MACRLLRKSLVGLVLACAVVASASAETTLVNYNFDYDVLDSGPDTYQIFRHKNAKAEISTDFAGGGYASAHFTDQAGDRDFVEFQGYFPEQQTGIVRFQFKLFIANAQNVFNIALVGKRRYVLSPQGINFWLSYGDGWLRHCTDSIPKKLFQPNLYEWYRVDVQMDLNRGVYALRIARETGEMDAVVEDQPFAAGSSDRYSLREYSFVGDLDDMQASDFYIDDLKITTSNEAKLAAMVAPGRRKYFVEIWDDYHRQMQGKLRCLPAKGLEDFGIYNVEYGSLERSGELKILHRLTRTNPEIGKPEDWERSPQLSAIVDWIGACDALEQGDLGEAETHIAAALGKNSSAYIFQLTSLIVAAAETGDFAAFSARVHDLPQYGGDVRNMIALAMVAFHSRRYAEASHERNIGSAFANLDRIVSAESKRLQTSGVLAISDDYISRLGRYVPDNWEQYVQWMVILEQRYYSSLWQGDYGAAYALATRVADTFARHGVEPGIWRERQGDCAFFRNDLETALDMYNLQAPISLSSQLKMADMYHMQSDLASEKSLRESIYRNFSRR